MYLVLMVQGCIPNINLAMDKNGEVKTFDSEKQAQKWAQKNCAWEYRIIKW